MSKKRDSFCIMPFIHLHNMSNGLMKMCCLTETPIVDDFGKTLFIGNQPIDEVWNNNFMQTVRRHMLENKELRLCNLCYQIEDTGGKSLRQEFNDSYAHLFPSFVEQARNNNGKINEFPAFVELRTGNVCNSACRMCNSNDSSLVYKENKDILSSLKNENFDSTTIDNGYSSIPDPEQVIFGLSSDRMKTRVMSLDNHFDEIIENIHNIKFITLSGGEPFLLEKTTILLEELANKNSNAMLYVNTNGSVLNTRIIEALKKINEVRICVSVDGYDTVQEYIRYPLKWEKIERNIHKLNAISRPGFYLTFNITVQALNMLSLDPLLTMLTRDFKNSYVNLSFLTSPKHYAVQNMPEEIKELSVKLNTELAEKIKNLDTDDDRIKIDNFRLSKRLLELNSFILAEPPNLKMFERFKDNIKIYDHYRKQNIENYIPEWKQFL